MIRWGFWMRRGKKDDERKDARLCRAEAEITELKIRADRVDTNLSDRANRNHWREAIEKLIQGA